MLFFGCSFTFGEGLQDDQTLPYQVGLRSGGHYRTLNFGFHGYGPHQMLAEIEQGIVRRVVDCQPAYAIYQAIPHHVARVAGKVTFMRHAPRYQMGPDGTVRLAGHFDDDGPKTESRFGFEVRWQLRKSAIYRMLQNIESRVSEDDVQLTLAVVGKSRDLLAAEYPGIKFQVILWESWKEEDALYRELQTGFRQMNIPVHLIEDILPGYTVDSTKYVLGTYDKHPNALANQIIADYVLNKIGSTDAATVASMK